MKYKIKVLKKKSGWYWRLEHKNGHVISHSECYSTRGKAVQTANNLAESFKSGLCLKVF